MADFNIEKVTAIPGSPDANTVYMVYGGSGDYFELYLSTSGSVLKRIHTQTDIQALIDASVAAMGQFHIVADITARDALSLAGNGNAFVLVEDASADGTVTAGAALYAFDDSDDSFVKLTEYESMDLVIDWSDIQNGPSSSAAQIDGAVTNSHTHSNKTQLDNIGQDGSGNLTYGGSRPKIEWDAVNW